MVASDLSPGMVERGRARSEADGYPVEWLEADAEELPFDDDRFDCVGSVFGAMIAPRPRQVAEQMFRVARPGGTVGMTAWTPESESRRLFEIGRRYQPSPPDLPKIDDWGREDTVEERFDGLAARIRMERRTLEWGAESVDAFEAAMAETPMAVASREALPSDAWEAMTAEQRELIESWAGGDGPVAIEVEYLLIVARKRG